MPPATKAASTTLFAAPVLTADAAIARVRDDLTRQFGGQVGTEIDLEQLASAAVRDLWRSPVKLFVPVLALRAARDAAAAAARRDEASGAADRAAT